MKPSLSNHAIPIGQAAQFLGVSIDTLRRWDKSGKLHSTRIDGKNRFFLVEELKKVKEIEKLTVSDVAREMKVSPSTVRRLEEKADFRPQRNEKGVRIYTKDAVSKLLRAAQDQKAPEKPAALAPKFSLPSINFASAGALTIIILVVTTALSTLYLRELYLRYEAKIARSMVQVLGAKDQGGIIGFISGIGERFVGANVDAFNKSRLVFLAILGRKTQDVQKFVINEGLIENLNAEFVQGKKPGVGEDDLAVFDSGGRIGALRISAVNLLAGSVRGGAGGVIFDGSIIAEDLASDAVTGSKILNDSIKNEDIADSAIKSAKIEDGTVTTSDLADTLTFNNGDLVDLSAVTHSSTSKMGLVLPNVSSASPSSPATGEGYLAYDTVGNQVLVYNGSSWTGIGGSVTLATGGGLAFSGDDLSLLRTCDSGQLLKWNGTSWICGDDAGGGGGGIATVEKANVNVVTTAVSLDYSSDFGVALDTGEGVNEADITIDYTTSKITRTDQTQSITGAWTFAAPVIIGNASGNDYLEFAEEATNPTCGAGLYAIWANSAGTLKKCQNGTITDLDTTGSGGSITVRETDASPSVSSVTTLEFGPTVDSTADFVVSDQTGGVARIILGSNVAHINATESVSGAWTLSNLTISDTDVSLSSGSTAFDLTGAADTIFDLKNSSTGTAKLRIDSLTNSGAGCNTIDTTADGTLICGTDEGGGGAGIATIKENDVNVVTSATIIDFLGADFIVGAVGTEGNVSIDYANSKITRKSDSSITFDAGIIFSTTGNTNGVTINTATGASGNSGAITIQTGGTTTSGTSGAILIDTGAGASANGTVTIGGTNASSVAIGRATVTTTINGTLSAAGVSISGGSINGTTIGAATPSTGAFTTLSSTGATTLGNNSTTVAVDGTNFDLSTAGVITLVGGQTVDITSAVTAGAGAALTLKPGLSTGASSNGGAVAISAGDGSGTTTVVGGALNLTAGSATGASGTRTGGNVTINAGDGATNDGIITIGSVDTRQVNLGNATNNTTITLTGTGLTTLGGDLTVSGGTFTGADSDVIEVGSVSNTVSFTLGAASEYTFNTTSFTLGADNSIGNGTWSISSTGAGTALSANDLTGCTNCIGATEVDESTISGANLSDGANIAHINAVETITGGWTFNTAATTFTTAINANGGITTSTTDTTLAFTVNGAGDYTFAGDQNSNVQLTNVLTSDATSINLLDFSAVINAAAGAATIYGVNFAQADNTTNTAVVDAIVRVQNANVAETTANGFLVEQTGAGTLTSAIHVLGTAGTITDAINIEDGAGTIADGIQFTGTFTNLINSTNFVVSNAGAVTAVGVNSGSGQIQGTGGVSVTGTTSINVSASTSTTAIGTGTTSGAITIGGGSNTITIATTSWDVASDGAFSGLTTLGLSGAITGATATNTINGVIINTGAVSNITTLSSSGDWTWTATTPTITINAAETFAISDGTDNFSVNHSGNLFSLTSGSNSFTFDADTGPLYAGNAQPARKVTLTPEYPGATLSGTGIGTMTSDFCEQGVHADVPDTNTASCEAGQIHNFYNWTTTQGTNQTYTAWVRWRVPDNWASWDTNPIQVFGRRSDATNGSVKVFVYDVGGVLNNAGGTEVASTANVWNKGNIALSGGTWTAGSYLTVRIDMVADNADNAKAGEININYKSNN